MKRGNMRERPPYQGRRSSYENTLFLNTTNTLYSTVLYVLYKTAAIKLSALCFYNCAFKTNPKPHFVIIQEREREKSV